MTIRVRLHSSGFFSSRGITVPDEVVDEDGEHGGRGEEVVDEFVPEDDEEEEPGIREFSSKMIDHAEKRSNYIIHLKLGSRRRFVAERVRAERER